MIGDIASGKRDVANTSPFDLADYHIYDNKCSSASNTSAAVHDNRSGVWNSTLPAVDVVEKVQNASRI